MKLFTFLLAIGFQTTFAQQHIEILLVGTSHQFKKEFLKIQRFETIIQKLKDFGPDIICIESIPTWDTASLKQVRKSSIALANKLKIEKKISTQDIDSLIDLYKKQVRIEPTQLIARSTLANLLFVRYDFWNAYYQWFTLEEKLQQKIPHDSSLLKTFTRDSIHKRIFTQHQTTEFGNLIFPLAQQLNYPYLFNIDDRADDGKFQSFTMPLVKRLVLNLKVFRVLRISKQLRKQTELAEQNGRLIQLINTPEFYQKITKMIDELPTRWVHSKKAIQCQNLWYTRNQRMAERIIEESQKEQAKKVIAFFGAAHLEFIKRELEKNPTVKVTMLNEMN